MKTSACEPSDSDAGTTLLEVLLVIALLSLILAATGFLTRSEQRVASLQSTASASIELLNAARLKSSSSGQPVRVGFDPATRSITSPAMEPTVAVGEGMEVRFEAAREAADVRGLGIVFYPDGSSTGGKITLTRDRETRIITVHWLTGLVIDGKR